MSWQFWTGSVRLFVKWPLESSSGGLHSLLMHRVVKMPRHSAFQHAYICLFGVSVSIAATKDSMVSSFYSIYISIVLYLSKSDFATIQQELGKLFISLRPGLAYLAASYWPYVHCTKLLQREEQWSFRAFFEKSNFILKPNLPVTWLWGSQGSGPNLPRVEAERDVVVARPAYIAGPTR